MHPRAHILVIAALLTLAETGGAQCADGSPPPCGPRRSVPALAVRARHFLVLPFRNVTRRPEQDWLVPGAPLMLSQSFGQFNDIDVVPDERVIAARRRLSLPLDAVPDAVQLRRLADETGGWTVVTGNVFATGTKLRITAQTMDAVTARVSARAEIEATTDGDPREAFDQLALRLLAPLGVSNAATTIVAMTTGSIDAYRAYARGFDLYQSSRFREALAEMSLAVRLDSTFALAWMGLGAAAVNANGVQELLNPSGIAYRSIERAARLAGRLHPRQAMFLRATQAIAHGETRRARRILDSLLTIAPDAFEAAFWLAATQFLGVPADTSARPPRLESDPNRAIALTRMILERDPSRRVAYQTPLLIYGLGGGLWWGDIFGSVREYGSLGATLIAVPDVRAVPVIQGDTIVLVPRATFDSLPESQQAALRRRSADYAWQWVERLLVAGPNDAESHLWAVRIAELRGDYERAWREMRIADSLGVQSGVENVAGRRLSTLLLSGRQGAATAMADSMLAAGTLTSAPFLRAFDRRRSYGVAALLLDKRWERAARMAEMLGKPYGEGDACMSLPYELVVYDHNIVPVHVKRAIMDTVRAHIAEVQANPILAPCARALSERLNDSTNARR